MDLINARKMEHIKMFPIISYSPYSFLYHQSIYSFFSYPSVTDHVSLPYTTTGFTIGLYILILTIFLPLPPVHIPILFISICHRPCFTPVHYNWFYHRFIYILILTVLLMTLGLNICLQREQNKNRLSRTHHALHSHLYESRLPDRNTFV